MRPVGAPLFGLWADRVGRRIPLIVDVIFYSTVGFLCAFAPNFTVLIVLRLLYGIGMGGEWGLVLRWRWRRSPSNGAGSSRSAAGGLLVRLSVGDRGVVGGHRLARPVVAVAVRAVHHPGIDPV
jgi:MFS family permease